MKRRIIVLIILESMVLILGIVGVVWAIDHNDPIDLREIDIGKFINTWFAGKAINSELGISVTVTDIEDGPIYDGFQDYDIRRIYYIAEDSKTVVPMLEEAGWQHTFLPGAFYLEGLLEDIPFDLKLRDLRAKNDHWWFYRDNYYEKYHEKSAYHESDYYGPYQYRSKSYTYAICFPDLGLLYYRHSKG